MHFGLFALRWITTLLSREFSLPDTVRLWDSLLSDPRRFGLVPYVCCAMLAHVRPALMRGDFSSNITLLQHFPSHDAAFTTECGVDGLVREAVRLYEADEEAKKAAEVKARQQRRAEVQQATKVPLWKTLSLPSMSAPPMLQKIRQELAKKRAESSSSPVPAPNSLGRAPSP